ncbi:MAG TPA: hypothetical protein ENO21_02775, partial [Firmicutes bacterium]|nr:hypothetical protein [Bacillota bacterium]
MSSIRYRVSLRTLLLALIILAVACSLALPGTPVRAALLNGVSSPGWSASLSLPGISDATYDIQQANGVAEFSCELEFDEELGRGFAEAQ